MNTTPNNFLNPGLLFKLQNGTTLLESLWNKGIYPSTRLCSIEGCFRKHTTKGLCESHRWQERRKKQWANKLSDERYRTWRREVEDRKVFKALRPTGVLHRKRPQQDLIKQRWKQCLYECKRRKKNNFEWLISLEDFRALCLRDCWYCGGVLGKVKFGKGLDRINNKGHYEIENVLPCCRTCNRIRGDNITVEEAKGMIKHLLILRGRSLPL